MIKLQLTGSKGGIALIDDEDFDSIKGFKWRRSARGYVVTSIWDKENKVVHHLFLHRYVKKAREDMKVDHIDHDLFNCQKYNLREATHQQNNFNRILSSKNKTGYKGVSIRKGRKKPYVAHIRIDGKTRYLGYFKTAQEAGEKYMKESQKLHGEFGTDGIFNKKIGSIRLPGRPRKLIRNDNTSKYTGLSYNKYLNQWTVRLQKNGIRKWIGGYKLKKDAIQALRQAKTNYE